MDLRVGEGGFTVARKGIPMELDHCRVQRLEHLFMFPNMI